MTGWECPGCGACYAPHVSQCGHCQPRAVPAHAPTPYVSPYPVWRPPSYPPPSPNTC